MPFLGIEHADDRVCNALEHGLAGDGVTNDQPALAALVDRLGTAHARDGRARVIYCPPGVYVIHDRGTVWRSGVALVGAGPAATRFVLSNPGDPTNPTPLAFFTAEEHGASPERHLADCTFADLEIDGSGVQLPQYDVLAKGLGLQYVLRGRFRNLYIHGTAATGFGCDFLQDSFVRDVVTVDCGRLDSGNDKGGAGIGIGIGGWGSVERLTVDSCTALASGTHGLFVELQAGMWPPPRGIRISGCHVEGNRYGISDWGADGLIVSGCTMLGNLDAGYDVSALGVASVGGRGGVLTACVIDGNVGDGVCIGDTLGRYVVRGNRISNNGGCGYRQHDIAGGAPPAREIVVEDNDVWGNALDGIRIDSAVVDAAILDNRIRNNGVRAARAAGGDGRTVSYASASLVDTAADWPVDGHRGKTVRAEGQSALVSANTPRELALAVPPGAPSAWPRGVPAPGTPYELPDAPATRAGIAIAAPAGRTTIRGNRVWDTNEPKTQAHGVWITETGSCPAARVEDNDLAGNAVGGYRFDTTPRGGHWDFERWAATF